MCTRAHVHLCACMLVTAHSCVTLGMDICVHPVCVDVSIFSCASACTWLCNSFHSLVISMGENKSPTETCSETLGWLRHLTGASYGDCPGLPRTAAPSLLDAIWETAPVLAVVFARKQEC